MADYQDRHPFPVLRGGPVTGAEIRAFRERLGMTQQELADALGVHYMTVGRWERGEMEPSPLLGRALRDLERERTTEEREHG